MLCNEPVGIIALREQETKLILVQISSVPSHYCQRTILQARQEV